MTGRWLGFAAGAVWLTVTSVYVWYPAAVFALTWWVMNR